MQHAAEGKTYRVISVSFTSVACWSSLNYKDQRPISNTQTHATIITHLFHLEHRHRLLIHHMTQQLGRAPEPGGLNVLAPRGAILGGFGVDDSLEGVRCIGGRFWVSRH